MVQQGLLCCENEKVCTEKNIALAKSAYSLFKAAAGISGSIMQFVNAAIKSGCEYAMPICDSSGGAPPKVNTPKLPHTTLPTDCCYCRSA
jgi:hypothetical protein